MARSITGYYDLLFPRYRFFFLLGIALVIIGLLFSKVLISLGSFMILGHWLLEGGLKSKIISFSQNKIALAISAFYLLHLLGMLYSHDIAYGIKDLRIKLPLILFPLVFSTSSPLSDKEFRRFHWLFLLAVFVATLVSLGVWIFGSDTLVSDKRNLSVFTSHIRFSLMVCLAFFICIYYYPKTASRWLKAAFLIMICWLPLFLTILESFTGLIVLSVTSFIFIFQYLLQAGRKKMMWTIAGIVALCLLLPVIYLRHLHGEFRKLQSPKNLPMYDVTAHGERYAHPATNNPRPSRQNGYIVYQNIAWDELIGTWNERSRIHFDSNALNGYPVKHIVLWYLSSKGWNKDKEAVLALHDYELHAIEKGVANYHYLNRPGIEARILQTFWEISHYLEGGDFNGHSVTMRWEFWKTSLAIIRQNCWFGVGTGDLNMAFKEQYEKDHSRLVPKWRLRSHNQYLSMTVAFGLIGLLIVCYSFFYPLWKYRRTRLYVTFCCILFLSMINEDTLETQTGATLFAFFNSFYLFLDERNAQDRT